MMAMAKTSGTPARRTGARATAKTTARTAQQPAPQTSGTARRARAVVCAAAIIVVLALVSAVLFDRRNETGIVGAARAHGFEHAVERGVTAMLVIDIDRREHVEKTAAKGLERFHRTNNRTDVTFVPLPIRQGWQLAR